MVESMVTIANHGLAMVTMVRSMVNHVQLQSSFRRGNAHINSYYFVKNLY